MIKSIVVENEDNAWLQLKGMLDSWCEQVSVVSLCKTIPEALSAINAHQPDLVFLDVELDNGFTGFDLLKQVTEPKFEIIFTTAHEKYALKAIRCSCLEYLIKPIQQEELIQAISKYDNMRNISWYQKKIETLVYNLNHPLEYAKSYFPTNDGYIFVNNKDIVYCEASGNYTTIFTTLGEKILVSKKIGTVEEMLDFPNFFRSHKSFVVNLDYVKMFDKKDGFKVIFNNGCIAEVAGRKKDEMLAKMGVK